MLDEHRAIDRSSAAGLVEPSQNGCRISDRGGGSERTDYVVRRSLWIISANGQAIPGAGQTTATKKVSGTLTKKTSSGADCKSDPYQQPTSGCGQLHGQGWVRAQVPRLRATEASRLEVTLAFPAATMNCPVASLADSRSAIGAYPNAVGNKSASQLLRSKVSKASGETHLTKPLHNDLGKVVGHETVKVAWKITFTKTSASAEMGVGG